MGGVTQIFPSHIGLLVFGLYNAIILEENFGNKYAVDEDSVKFLTLKNYSFFSLGNC